MEHENEGWRTTEAARHYLRIADALIPGRAEVMALIARLAGSLTSNSPIFLDLGCGYGDVTAEIMKIVPNASFTLIDFSDEMLKMASTRFSNNSKIKILKYDMNNGIPLELRSNNYDAVVSCLALHHIEFQNRVQLYTNIQETLKPNGIFINGDRFIGESPVIDEWEFDNWISWMTERAREKLGVSRATEDIRKRQLESDKKLGDKPGTLWSMRDDLMKAGFKKVDCLYKNQIIAVIVAQ